MHSDIEKYLSDCVKANTSEIITMDDGHKFLIKKLSPYQMQMTIPIIDLVYINDIDEVIKSVGINIRDVNCRYDLDSDKINTHTRISKDYDDSDFYWITADHTQSLEVTILAIKDTDTIVASDRIATEKVQLAMSSQKQYHYVHNEDLFVLMVSPNKSVAGVLINGEHEDISTTYEIREQTFEYTLFVNMRLIQTPIELISHT
jgi:hypothetical protein